MGPVVSNLDSLPEHFLVMNGDVLTDLDYRALLQGHAESGAPLTVAAYDRVVKIDFGVLEIGGPTGDRIVEFREKPVEHFSVSMGVYAASPRDAARLPRRSSRSGFDELVLDLMAAGDPPRVHRFDGYWLDIGRPDDYDRANEEWDVAPARLLPGGDPPDRDRAPAFHLVVYSDAPTLGGAEVNLSRVLAALPGLDPGDRGRCRRARSCSG